VSLTLHLSPPCLSYSFALSDVKPRSLILVDELGKGTEVYAGTALAGAMLEQLSGSGCAGVFATHLHMLLPGRLELNAPGLTFAKMGVRERRYKGGWGRSWEGVGAGVEGVGG
jgi:DNA mismatch repair ATPase MutS